MTIRSAAWALAAVMVAAPSWAQDHRIEVSGLAGWTFSDGVTGDGVLAADGNIYNEIGPKDSFNWGLTIAYNFTDNYALEFMYDQQVSTLEVAGTRTTEIGDFKVATYHGAFVYNAGDPDATVRPFIFLGAGATDYPGVNFTAVNGQTREIGGSSKFSGTFGAGIKAYPSSTVGIRLQARWTPTYIKSDAEGYWCDPYWGCYTVGDAQYSNQFQFSGGITLRF
jgi:outer membrane protein W